MENIKRLEEIIATITLEKAAVEGGRKRLEKLAAELDGLVSLSEDAEFEIAYAATSLKDAITALEKISGKTAKEEEGPSG